jgi:D-sedoheptulose 7-phosphate isomerase
MLNLIKSYLNGINRMVDKISVTQVKGIIDILLRAYEDERFIFIMGNGGSAATASHFACDLSKGTICRSDKRFKVIALTDNVPLLTAWANDTDYEHVFAEQLSHFIGPGDVVLGISGSGNSPNIINAVRLAAAKSAITIGLTGFKGGLLKDVVDHCLIVPSDNMQHIEDLHMILTHLVSSSIRDALLLDKGISGYEYIDFGPPRIEGIVSPAKGKA